MKELGMVLVGIFAFGIFFSTMIYPNLEYTGYQSAHTCTGECYEEYVRVHGTTVEILQAKQLADAGDPFHLSEDYGLDVQLVMDKKVKVWQSFLNLLVNLNLIL